MAGVDRSTPKVHAGSPRDAGDDGPCRQVRACDGRRRQVRRRTSDQRALGGSTNRWLGENNPRLSKFNHGTVEQLRWINELCTPSSISEELTSRGALQNFLQKEIHTLQTQHKPNWQGEDTMMCISSLHNPRTFQEDAVALVASLKACAKQKDLDKGIRLHDRILKAGLIRTDVYVGTALVHMYAKCGALAKAQEVFDELPHRNVVSWSVLISGYAQHDRGHEALKCFKEMQHQGLSPDAVTFSCILKACGSIGAADKGEQIHAEVIRRGLLEKNIIIGNALVDMYAKCGRLAKAQELFDELPVRDTVSWNALIAGYSHHGHGHAALSCFEQMQSQGLSPDAITFTSIVKACGCVGAAEKGEEIHAEVVRQGLLKRDAFIGSALVDMYVKCGALAKAQEVFDKLSVRNVFSWSALIAGYAQHGYGHEALNNFERMQHEGLSPDAITFTCILKACGTIGAAEKGEEIHAKVVRQGLLEKDTFVGNALVDMYGKCGKPSKAQEVFNELPVRDLVAWNALIGGYVQQGHGHEALDRLEWMKHKGLSPNAVTFTCILKACGIVGAAEKGEEIHSEIVRQGLLENNPLLGSALVDMYSKCGSLAKAQRVFDELPARDLVSWNALIAGCTQLGKAETVFDLFNNMIGEGIEPDAVTFIILLNACSHSGLVEEGQMYFYAMTTIYGLFPTVEHHTCMVDLFGRAQLFGKALGVIEKMSSSSLFDYLPLWSTLLGACQKWGHGKLGRLAFEHVIQLDEKDTGAYVCMRNIYAAASM